MPNIIILNHLKVYVKSRIFAKNAIFFAFFEIFDLWVIFRFFSQNRLKMALEPPGQFPLVFLIKSLFKIDGKWLQKPPGQFP